ncbi:MAG: hypothetical protein BroJett026_35870 [Betaproteobacteria bacterium]|nr:MAG: hypothetical protein BroJett026_35870 [Betaproteobacteria bacterium]
MTDSLDHDRPADLPSGAQARALLDECFRAFRGKLVDIGRASIEMSGDLFEGNSYVQEKDVDEFRAKRGEWIARFDAALGELYERRMSGTRRKGRRADFDASIASLKVLTAFDQEKQAALVAATAFLERMTRRELEALDLRVEALLAEERRREVDNPFGPSYILDAIGMSARAVYPNPRVWRAFMERVVADLTPAANKVYITLNRLLADRDVLPEIKAALRARSDLRPADDKDLIPTFSQMLREAGPALPSDVEVPQLGDGATASVFDFEGAAARSELLGALVPSAMLPNALAPGAEAVRALPADLLLRGLEELGKAAAPRPPASDGDALFPDLDPLMALGTSTPLFNTLGHWQRIDLPAELAKSTPMPEGTAMAAIPLNLIPHIRAAVAGQIANPTDRITMDVIALLFDYVFRDPSIPDAMRRIFGRLQVPVLKAALLDRTFFSDRQHPARRLLDHLADAAIGATHNPEYEQAFEKHATAVVERVCNDFEIDVAAFAAADRELAAFIDAERKATAVAVAPDVAQALATEAGEADRAEVLTLTRDKLAGLDLPFEVRGFVETVWTDYLTKLRRDHGGESAEYRAAAATLDDLLWSIVAKERTGQKARLTKMIPGLVVAMRKGCAAVGAPAEKSKVFFDALYPLHVAAIKPPPPAGDAAADAAPAPEAVVRTGIDRGRPAVSARNAHDFVTEMAVGTWLVFRPEGASPVNARLTWVSPRRTRYIFTSRSRRHALMFSPEELAWELAADRAALLLEPVPLFDRAVSAALDTLAATKPDVAGARAA